MWPVMHAGKPTPRLGQTNTGKNITLPHIFRLWTVKIKHVSKTEKTYIYCTHYPLHGKHRYSIWYFLYFIFVIVFSCADLFSFFLSLSKILDLFRWKDSIIIKTSEGNLLVAYTFDQLISRKNLRRLVKLRWEIILTLVQVKFNYQSLSMWAPLNPKKLVKNNSSSNETVITNHQVFFVRSLWASSKDFLWLVNNRLLYFTMKSLVFRERNEALKLILI